jgi:drug/metabolite transporter (DMT)-like permease
MSPSISSSGAGSGSDPSSDHGPPQNVLRGMMFMVISTIALVSMNTLARHMSDEFHPFQIAFFRSFFGFLFFMPWFIRYGFEPLRTKMLSWHAARGVANGVCMLMYFMGLSLIPLAKVMALSFSSPLFATIIAFITLGEVIRTRRITALIIGLAGTMIILRPGFVELDLGSILILGACAAWAGCLVIIKVLARTESSVTITLYSTIFLMPVSLTAAIPYWQWPNIDQLLLLAVMGIAGSIGQTALAQSFREADMTAVMPLEFLRLVWAALFGYFFFAEVPDVWVWTGGSVIFAASFYIAIRERQFGKQTPETAPPVTHP